MIARKTMNPGSVGERSPGARPVPAHLLAG